MANTSTPKHVAPSLGSRDSLPHPIPGGDIHSVPDSDDLLFYFQETKRLYGEISEYVQSGRAVFLQRADDLLVRVVSLDASLGLVDPRAAVTLAQMRGEADAERQGYIKEVEIRDGQVEPCKGWCRTRLNWMMQQNKPATMTLVKDMEWPTFSVCQDLGLNPDFFQAFLPTGDIQAMDDIQDDKDATIRELRKMIHELQQERILWRQQLQQDTKMSKDTPVKVMKVESGDSFNNMQETYKERRRRTRIPVFEKGSMDEAQKWLNRYESLAGYLGFHGQDKIDELNAVLMGQALNWFEGLGADEKKSWETVKSMFLHQFGSGANPALAALDQLKNAKQGSKETIGEFAPKLKDLLYRAQVFSPAIQLDYFKDKIKPELKTAVIFARARNLEEGINIATEIERELLRKNQVPDLSSLIPEVKSTINYGASSSGSSSNLTTGEIQNYQQRNGKKGRQENRSCHYCKKVGHLKKNCRKRLRDLQEQHGKTQHNNHQDVKNTEEEEEEFDIFEQFVNQQDGIQEVVVQAEKNPRRFHYVVKQADGQGQQVLVDTGSTISTITRKKCVDLGLLTCQGPVTKINYGNASQQYTTTKAVWLFKLGNQPTMAHLHVVEKQNEDIILGMDWMVYEDIWLHPKSKAILKIKQEGVNNMEEVVKKNFPSLLVDDSGQQTITNATYRHQIDTGDSQPVTRRDYRRSEVEKKAIEEEVQKMLKSGVIVPSNSDWCSPVVLIKKPDGSFRFCVDYRGLNKVTKKDKYPLPRIDELLDKLHGAKYFLTIDLKSGYWQLPLDPKDAKKTAFIANGSLYEFTVMPFGVVNGPASFMRFMNNVLRGLPQTMIYLDDIICYHATYQEHKKGLQEVLQRLVKYNLKISITKCQFFQKEVKFLGFLVSGQGIRSDPTKTEVVKTWPTPTSVKSLQKFLGFCAFYHRFLVNLADVAKPLYKLLREGKKNFVWSAEAERSFSHLKERMINLPTLAYPDPTLPYDLHTDASNVGLGAVLVQSGRPIAYASRTLSDAERNYSTTERECLAIVWSLNYFYPYLYGAQFSIYTDHAALKSILATKMPRGRIARWILTIQSFTFTIFHRKGALCGDADALSRIPEDSVNAQDLDELTQDRFKQLQHVVEQRLIITDIE